MTKSASSRAHVPDLYLDVKVPERIQDLWFRWEGAEWRRMRHMGTNNLFPPDQRYSVRPPRELCALHHEHWVGYRNMNYDPVSGNRWPGGAGSPFIPVGRDLNRVSEERRCEWDEKASGQMLLIETICLSGTSPQCSPNAGSPDAELTT
ncbi:hypothetical protein [Streptomyces sp. NBC_01264]|uniref:hypothetical protein n=1 Tax=Streptomyces sp. NBC_01264 TaxID=2903804 RepID=UPI00225BE1D7|nr:hypothetical protein [Streptomyces sp. NBC_01264]MCX4783901.1 hypothetical protein [Streptomyces sp. NBC_01264]